MRISPASVILPRITFCLAFLAPQLLPAQQPILVTHALLLKAAPQPWDVPVARDPIQYRMVAGTWAAPAEGDAVRWSDTLTTVWKAVEADSAGWFTDPALSGAYVCCSIELDRERTMLLSAGGHSMVYVNGVPRAGNPYRDHPDVSPWEPRFDYAMLPVRLHKGRNELLFSCQRGALTVSLLPMRAGLMVNPLDATLPDAIADRGDAPARLLGAVVVINGTDARVADAVITAAVDGMPDVASQVPAIPPMSVRKIPFRFARPRGRAGDALVRLTLTASASTVDTASVAVRIVDRSAPRKETFRSGIDSSVQYYAINPSRDTSGAPQALILSLHGASVEGISQASAYEAKSWGHIVAPTNRRPYGFNWEDWGRLDAMEVLRLVKQRYRIDESEVYLTGHSMGGHGTWHLGVTFPDQWAAIGPSAGWISFWSYRGRSGIEPKTPLRALFTRATLPSDTYAMARNLAGLGVYVIHGADDDNVPVREARSMVGYLATFHHDVEYYERPGAGHWWDASDEPGADCVDWPLLFDFFGGHRRPAEKPVVRHVRFRTASPGVSSSSHWVSILQQDSLWRISEVDLLREPGLRRVTGTTSNVRTLRFDARALRDGADADDSLFFDLDGQTVACRAGEEVILEKRAGSWAVGTPPPPEDKRPARYGALKDAFRNGMVFVYGTGGTESEQAWAFAKARYDAERFWYQGNGSIDVVSDTEFNPAAYPDRNIIVFGNAVTNRAWKFLFPASPVQVTRGAVTIGDRVWKGADLGCVFVRPRQGSATACVAAISGTGVAGMRSTDRLAYLAPAAGFPDLLMLRSAAYEKGEEGIPAAGYFGLDWGVNSGEFVFSE